MHETNTLVPLSKVERRDREFAKLCTLGLIKPSVHDPDVGLRVLAFAETATTASINEVLGLVDCTYCKEPGAGKTAKMIVLDSMRRCLAFLSLSLWFALSLVT